MTSQPLLDQDGHLCDHTLWTPAIAQTLADTLDVTLTPLHLQILLATRQFFATYHHAPTTRPLIKYLATQLDDTPLDNQTLQSLFKTGLVARHINRLAGLPNPLTVYN